MDSLSSDIDSFSSFDFVPLSSVTDLPSGLFTDFIFAGSKTMFDCCLDSTEGMFI